MMRTNRELTKTQKNQPRGNATTRSTAGPGFAFEDQVGAWLLLKMLSGEAMPGMSSLLGFRLQSQTSALGWLIDDLLVTCGPVSDESHLAISCKSSVQVTSSGIPDDFISAAWKQFAIMGTGPRHTDRDNLALVTRGRHPAFQAIWADIKLACTSTDMTLALNRINRTKRHRTVFESIAKIAKAESTTIRDEDVLAFISHLHVVPTDFDLEPSEYREVAISQCRRILASGDTAEAHNLWQALVGKAENARLGNGTIDLPDLWHELRTQFNLNDHPDFSAGWRLLRAFTSDHITKIETVLPSGYTIERTEESEKLTQALLNYPIVVLYGDSGTGKSALAKLTLKSQFSDTTQIWLSPDTLKETLSEVERIKNGLIHPLSHTLLATPYRHNILIIDAAEHIGIKSTQQVKQLIEALIAEGKTGETSVWRVLIVSQTEAWREGRIQGFVGDVMPTCIELRPPPIEQVKDALLSSTHLSWLAYQDEAVSVLNNLRALAWVLQAPALFTKQNSTNQLSITAIADSLWKFWTDGQKPLQKFLILLGVREASFEQSIAISELSDSDARAFDERPPQLPLRISSRNRVEFQHDLAAEWARFQRLKEISDDVEQWSVLATNPLWTGALRMLGQFLLRTRIDDQSEWDVAFKKLNSEQLVSGLAMDILLDALWMDTQAELFLTEHAELLFANHGALLDRMLLRFNHLATVPNNVLTQTQQLDQSLRLYIEAQNRAPIFARWPTVIRFLTTHQNQVASLISPVVAKLCETWLTALPVEVVFEGAKVPIPFRKELAELALATARALQVAQGKRVIFADDSKKSIYTAAFAGAQDIPDEVSNWALEMAERRIWLADVTEQIYIYQQEQAKKQAERLKTDAEYRLKQKRLLNAVHIHPSERELPPWPLGPQARVDNGFCDCCTHSNALIPLFKVRPDAASEVLLATIVEDSPKEQYGTDGLFNDEFGLNYDQKCYPTAYWKSPFFNFLQINPEKALDALISLVDFCTERCIYTNQRRGFSRSSIQISFQSGGQKEFLGNYSVFCWAQTNSLHTGQLHSALAALEKWLCVSVENDNDVTPYIERILESSHSVAILGVLLSVGKFHTTLFHKLLRPLLANSALYYWDSLRIDNVQFQFDTYAWKRQGELIFKTVYDWHFATHHIVTLRELAGYLVAFHYDIAEFLVVAIELWEPTQGDKVDLELQMLKAELNFNNYTKTLDEKTEDISILFAYPEPLQQKIQDYDCAVTPLRQVFSLPVECNRLLSKNDELTEVWADHLAKILSSTNPTTEFADNDQRTARIAAASTLLARARHWLDAHNDVYVCAQEIVQDVIDQIDDDIELLRKRELSWQGDILGFVTHAVMQEFISSKGTSEKAGSALLRILTCGDESATYALISIAYQHRKTLGPTWWRILELSLLWCGLIILAPRADEPQSIQKLWGRWLRWLQSRKLTEVNGNPNRITPLAIAQRIERLQRRRWVREFTRERSRFVADPSERRSSGLDTHLLKATYAWLFQEISTKQQLVPNDFGERVELLKNLLNFELRIHVGRSEDKRDVPPTKIGYEILPAIAKMIPSLPEKEAAELWQPIFQLGGNGHYILGHFIECWLQQIPHDCDISVFSRHWRQMIEYALNSTTWSNGHHWYNGELLMCRLLGCGYEKSLDRVPYLQNSVLKMRDLYELWATKHLDHEEDLIVHFSGFLISSTARRLRLEGIQWLNQSLQNQSDRGRYWRRTTTAAVITDLLDVILTEDSEHLKKKTPARDALLDIVAILVKIQSPAALALQERVRKKF